MEYLFIYMLQMADLCCTVGISSLLICAGLILLSIFMYFDILCTEEDDFLDYFNRKFRKNVLIFLSIAILCLFAPTKQTLTLMGGLYMGKQIAKTQVAQKTYEVINLELDKLIKDLKQ